MTSDARTPEERATDAVELPLPDDSSAPSTARRAVRETFSRWGLTVLVDDAELAVSELVTNALKHGLPPVQLTLCQSERSVRIDVSDTRPATATREWPVASLDSDESGRGRGIVAAVSDHCGTEVTSDNGKSSFAAWDLVPGARSD